jgi:hypothetical protein
MTARTAATGALRTHLVVGQRELVSAALMGAYRDGRLRAIGQSVELDDGRVQVTAELLEPAAPASPAGTGWRRARACLLGLVVALAVAAVVGLVWLLFVAMTALIGLMQVAVAWISSHLLLIGLVALGLLLLAGSSAAGCTGLHCRGCRG